MALLIELCLLLMALGSLSAVQQRMILWRCNDVGLFCSTVWAFMDLLTGQTLFQHSLQQEMEVDGITSCLRKMLIQTRGQAHGP